MEDMVHVLCPCCKKRLFDASRDTSGMIAIKCPYCKSVVAIRFKNQKIKAEKSAVK